MKAATPPVVLRPQVVRSLRCLSLQALLPPKPLLLLARAFPSLLLVSFAQLPVVL